MKPHHLITILLLGAALTFAEPQTEQKQQVAQPQEEQTEQVAVQEESTEETQVEAPQQKKPKAQAVQEKAASKAQAAQQKAAPKAKAAEKETPAETTPAVQATQEKATPEAAVEKEETPAEAKPAAQAAPESGIRVSRIAIAPQIENREPKNAAEKFAPDVQRLFCFTHIVGVKDSTQVIHKWYHNKEQVSVVPLRIASPSWRTFSSKPIDASEAGEWHVEVVHGEDETVLETINFKIE